MISYIKRLFSRRQTVPAQSHPRREARDPWESLARQPLSLDAQLDIANGRASEEQVMRRVHDGIRKFRESANGNPASLWAMSLVDPYSWGLDTPDFYPGLGAGMSGFGVPWLLNNMGRGDVLPVYINEMGLKLIRDWSRRILAFNEFAINAVENRISYIVGRGFQYTVLPKKKATQAANLGAVSGAEPSDLASKAQAVIDEFVSRERWCEREQECVKRCDRDGEAFLRFFHVGRGRATVRFIEPECVTDGQGTRQSNYGIITEDGDIEDVLAYSVVEDPSNAWVTHLVAADEILHVKVNTDLDAKRGLPTLFPVRKNLERADKLLRNMSVMGQVQATFAVIRKHKQFAPSSVQAYQGSQTDLSTVNPVSGRSLGIQQYYPGSVIDTSDKTEYEFPSANVNASGLVAVLQAELRAVAACVVMPEWMLTVDASNGNFAGQLVSGAPSVENFKRKQAFYARRFGDGEYGLSGVSGGRTVGALWRVLAIAVDGGLLPPESLTSLEIQAEGPSVTVVNKSAETARAKTLSEKGLLSNETWAKWEGLDYKQEVALGAKAQAAAPAPGMPGADAGMPKSAPPGSDIGGAGSVGESVQEGVSGTKKDSLGRDMCFLNGEHVPCSPENLPGNKERSLSADKREKKSKSSRKTKLALSKSGYLTHSGSFKSGYDPSQKELFETRPKLTEPQQARLQKALVASKTIQDAAEENEMHVAAKLSEKLKGEELRALWDNEPFDALATGGGRQDCLEIKTLWTKKDNSPVKMDKRQEKRKDLFTQGKLMVPVSAAGEIRDNEPRLKFKGPKGNEIEYVVRNDPSYNARLPRRSHVVAIDHREDFQAHAAGERSIEHRQLGDGNLLYRREAKPWRPDEMIRVRGSADLANLMRMSDNQYARIVEKFAGKTWPPLKGGK